VETRNIEAHAMDLNQVRRILVYRIGQLGDTIVALPAMWVVRRTFPNAYLALLSDRHSESGYVCAEEVLPSKGLFDEYLSYDAGINGTDPRNPLTVLPVLRQRRFDTLVYLAPRLRRHWQVCRDLLFFRLAGIQRFIGHKGFDSLPARAPGTELARVNHEADHLLDRLAISGIQVKTSDRGYMDLGLTRGELLKAEKWLDAHRDDGCPGPVIAFGPGSKSPAKTWPIERYAMLGRRLIKEYNAFPMVFGGPRDRSLGEYLLTQWKCGVNAAGELSVRQAAPVIGLSQLYVGNDTGTMHLATAVGTTCVVAFAALDWPGRWYPYGDQQMVLRRPVSCEGCMRSVCTDYGMACMTEISVEDMWRACQRVLTRETRQPMKSVLLQPSVKA